MEEECLAWIRKSAEKWKERQQKSTDAEMLGKEGSRSK